VHPSESLSCYRFIPAVAVLHWIALRRVIQRDPSTSSARQIPQGIDVPSITYSLYDMY